MIYEVHMVTRTDVVGQYADNEDGVHEYGMPVNELVYISPDLSVCQETIRRLIVSELNRIVSTNPYAYDTGSIDLDRGFQLYTGPEDEGLWGYRKSVWFDIVDFETGEIIFKNNF